MIRYNTKRYWGYSGDTKPVDAQIGDRFLELDTKREYFFGNYNSWNLIGASGGTVSGGVNPTYDYIPVNSGGTFADSFIRQSGTTIETFTGGTGNGLQVDVSTGSVKLGDYNNLDGNFGPYFEINNASNYLQQYAGGSYINMDGPTRTITLGDWDFAYDNTRFIVDDSNHKITLESTNGVGINTTSPTNALHISGVTDSLRIEGLVSGNTDNELLSIDSTGVVHKYPLSLISGGTGGGVTSITTSGTGLSANTTTGAVTIVNTKPDQTVTITGGTNIQITGTYPNFGITVTGTTSGSGAYLPLSGGTMTGGLIANSGVTATTISATTYYGVNAVTGGTYSNGTITLGGSGSINTTISGLPQGTITAVTESNNVVTVSSNSSPTTFTIDAATGGTYSNGVITLQGSGSLSTITGLGGSGGGGQVYYLNLSNAQTPYREFSPIPTTAAQQTTGVTINNGVTATIAEFLTPTTYPNTVLIPAGIWSFYLHSYKENDNAAFNIFCEVYKRTSGTGGTETLLFTTDSTPVTTNSPNAAMYLTDGFYSGSSINFNDRILVKVRATNTGNQSHIVTLLTEGSQHYSYATTSFGTGVPNYTTGGTYDQSTGVLTFTRTDGNIYTAGTFNYLTGSSQSGNVLTLTTNTGQTFTYTPISITGGTYSNGTITFGGSGGIGTSITGLSQYFVSGSTPTGTINNGDRWFDTTNGVELVYLNDGDSSQWIQPNMSVNATISGTFSATTINAGTISASTYQNLPGSSGSNCISTLYASNISGCSPVTILTPVNITQGANITGVTYFYNNVIFSSGITISSTTNSSFASITATSINVNGNLTTTGNTSLQGLTATTTNTNNLTVNGVLTTTGNTSLQGLTATTISAATYNNLPNTLYTGDGVISSNRTVSLGANSLKITGGSDSSLFIISGANISMGASIDTTTKLNVQTSGLALKVTSSQGPALQVYGGSNSQNIATFYTFTGSAEKARISKDGYLSIGTTDTTLPLNVNGTISGITLCGQTITSTGIYGTATLNAGNSQSMLVISGSGTVGGAGYIDFIKVTNTSAGATNINKTIRVNSTGGLEILRSDYNATILTVSDGGIMAVGGNNTATTSNSDGVTNYLTFNNNNSQIYDDGNFHIHSRGVNQVMWINTNGGGINLGTQSPLLGGSIASSINCGTGAVTGYFNINTGRTFTDSRSYGYLTTGGAGTYGGGSQSVTVSLYATDRIWGQEIDAFSDERMKDIQGEVTLDDGLKLVNNLKPIKYTWKNGEDKGLKVGYSAQQVSKSGFDHLVALMPREGLEETIDTDGFVSPKDTQFSMNYDQVVPYHGVVIKHLLEKIEQMEKEIKKLKNK